MESQRAGGGGILPTYNLLQEAIAIKMYIIFSCPDYRYSREYFYFGDTITGPLICGVVCVRPIE